MTCNSGKCFDKCPDQFGNTGDRPDFVIRRHDTQPQFKVKIDDCDGPLDLTDLVLEANMWAKGKLKKSLSETDTYFSLADGIGFHQIMLGDVIIMDRPRVPEHMLVTGFDEVNKFVQVQRGYHGTTPQKWKKGDSLRIMKFTNAVAQTEMVYKDVLEIDGTTTQDVLVESYFIYDWSSEDTCLPGFYYLEFKLIKMANLPLTIQSISPSFTPSFTPSDYGCEMPSEIEWIRRFPVAEEGFIIQIVDSPTREF